MAASHADRRPWLVATLVLLASVATQVGWMVTLPPYSATDEVDHMLRASAVAEGHLAGGWQQSADRRTRGDLIAVRTEIAEAVRAPCESLPTKTPENCRPVSRVGPDQVRIASGASRYNPTYYLLISPTLAVTDGRTADLAARAVGSVVCALLLAWAAFVAAQGGGRWRLLMLMLAVVPTAAFSFAVAAPNGIQMAAGLGLWFGLAALLRIDEPAPDSSAMSRSAGPALGLTTLCGILLPLTHTLGLAWLILIVAALGVLLGPRNLYRRWRTLGAGGSVSLALVGLAAVAAVIWILSTRVNNPFTEHPPIDDPLLPRLPDQLMLWPLQALGAFPFRNNAAPTAVYALGLATIGVALLLGLRSASSRTRLTVVLLIVASFVIPTALTIATYQNVGIAWQGRYEYPFAVGMFVLLAYVRPAPRTQTLLVALAALAWALSSVLSWIEVRGMFDDPSSWARQAGWQPPSALLLAGLAIASLLLWTVALSRGQGDLDSVERAAASR